MHHKAQEIFETIVRRFFSGDKPTTISTIYAGDYAVDVMPHYDSGKVSYLKLSFYNMGTGRPNVMMFSINSGGGMVVDDGYEVDNVRFPQEECINLMIEHLGLGDKYQTPISVKEIGSIPAGSNPYRHDEWRMGASISKFWEVMHTSRGDGDIDNVILIHTKTGRRFSLDLYEAEKPVVEKQPSLDNDDEKLAG